MTKHSQVVGYRLDRLFKSIVKSERQDSLNWNSARHTSYVDKFLERSVTFDNLHFPVRPLQRGFGQL